MWVKLGLSQWGGRFRVFKNRLLRKTFGSERKEVRGD
jgi:hypothetical protein